MKGYPTWIQGGRLYILSLLGYILDAYLHAMQKQKDRCAYLTFMFSNDACCADISWMASLADLQNDTHELLLNTSSSEAELPMTKQSKQILN